MFINLEKRIKKLEREGVVKQYVSLLNKEKVDRGFLVFCQIKLVQHTKEFLTKFEKEVTKLDEVIAAIELFSGGDVIMDGAAVGKRIAKSTTSAVRG